MATEKKTKNTKKRDVSPVVKFFFTIGVLAILLFIGVFLYDRIYNNPKDVLDEYVDAFMAKSPSRLFRVMDYDMTAFITPDNLDTLLEEKADYHKITSYSLVPEQTGGDERKYHISYMVGRQESPFSQTLTLKKSDEKKWFILDKWYIDGSDFIGKNITLRVPLGAEITVDNRRLGENGLRKKSETTQDYELGNMFVGEHEFEVTLDGFQTFSDKFTVQAQDYYSEPIFTVTQSQMTPDEENRAIVEKLIAKIIPLVYDDWLERRSFDYLQKQVAIEASTSNALRKNYEVMADTHIDSVPHLTYVDFHSFDSQVSSTLSTDNCYALRVDTVVSYTAHSTVVHDEEAELRERNGKRRFTSIFHYSDGQWWLYDSDVFEKFINYAKE